jgi:transposase
VVTAPEQLREQLRDLSLSTLVHACTRFRPGAALADPCTATKTPLRSLARRYEALTAEITETDKALRELVAAAAPTLLGLPGVGVEVAGQLLVTAGDDPDRLRSEGAFAQRVVSHRWRPAPGAPSGTGSTAAATEAPTTPSTPSS